MEHGKLLELKKNIFLSLNSKVFLTEYFGPLAIYFIFYLRPSFIYVGHGSRVLAKYDPVTK